MSERQRIRNAFHRGAALYDQHTPVQQRVVDQLLLQVQQQPAVDADLLDVGCGTGRLLAALHERLPLARLTGLDLAPNMLRQAAARLPADVRLVSGDAEQLPFADASFDLVVSTSTFQWLHCLDVCFGEVRRVLRPGGRFVFSLFGQGTLLELQESWRAALVACNRPVGESRDGTHRFHRELEVREALCKAGFQMVSVRSTEEVLWYPDLPHLLQAVKRIGAGSARPPEGGGLGWRRVLHCMAELYRQRYGTAEGVPARYCPIYAEGSR